MNSENNYKEHTIRYYDNGNEVHLVDGVIICIKYAYPNDEYDAVYFKFENGKYVVSIIITHDNLFFKYESY